MRGASPFTKAGASFRERQRTIDNDTKERAELMAKEVSVRTKKAIDDFELLHNMVDDEDIKKSKKDRKRKNKKEPEKEEEVVPQVAPDTSRSGHNYAIRPCECTLFYNYGSATVRPAANTNFDTKLRESVQSSVHGTKKTFLSAPFGGQSFCLAETVQLRPSVEPVLPVHGIADVPPLARSLSRRQIQDRGGANNQKTHPMIRMNRAANLRQAQNYRYLAQSEIQESFNEQFEWESQRGRNFHNVGDRYHLWLEDQAVDTTRNNAHGWMLKKKDEWTPDEKKTYEILSRFEDYLHEYKTRAGEVFKLMDTNHSGEIDPDELFTAFSTRAKNEHVCGLRLGIIKPGELTREDMWNMMFLIDPNCDGTISLKDLDHIINAIEKLKIQNGDRKRWTFDHNWTAGLQDETIGKMNMDALEPPQ